MYNNNLLTKNEPVEANGSMSKILTLAILGVITSCGASYFINDLFEKTNPTGFVLAASFIILFIVLFFLQSLFIRTTKIHLLLILIETLGLSSFLVFNNQSLIVFVAIPIAYFFLYSSFRKTKNTIDNQLKIRELKAASLSVPKIITAIIILISVVYSQPFYPENLVISKSLIRRIIAPSELIIKLTSKYLPVEIRNFSIEMTANELAEENNIHPLIVNELLKKMGLQLAAGETIIDNVFNLINEKVDNLDKKIKWIIFGSILLLTFLTLKGFFWLFRWLIIYVFIYIFYEISMALGFSRLTYEKISKEIIVL
jgi:hypothetical protein